MAGRRFGPLIALVLLATALVLGRLFQVQVVENDVWANEAANLVRSGAVVPYERGRIVDRRGRVLAHDEEVYRVEFRYRDFRRGHPLGQVAHAWSAIAQRPVPLDEAFGELRPVAADLVQLTHLELAGWVQGDALERGSLRSPAVEDPAAELRLGRRADVRFYLGRLLGLDRRQALDALRAESSPSLLSFAAKLRQTSEQELLRELDQRLLRAEDDLRQLAVLLADAGGDDFEGARSPRADLARLIVRLEEWRVEVEDATASELFREAAGFSAGRVADRALLERFDLGWLAALMRWDGERVRAWAVGSREAWRLALTEWHIERMGHELDFAAAPATVVGGWSRLFVERDEEGRSSLRPLIVFSELDSLFDVRVPRRMRVSRRLILPVQDPSLAPDEGANFEDLARLELWSAAGERPSGDQVRERAEEWRAHFEPRLDREWAVDRMHDRLLAWESALQEALGGQLEQLAAHAGRERLSLSKGRLDRAEERARSVLKDRGSRPREIEDEPDYALVHLLTRFPDRFAGCLVRKSTERMLLEDGAGTVLLEPLLGNVRAPAMRELMAERGDSEELARLLRRGRRDSAEEADLERLVKKVTQFDELLGGDGIEGHFDVELSGKNGYREQRGLAEIRSGKSSTDIPPEDGSPLRLTLDLDLQLAALDCLRNPAEDPRAIGIDYDWLLRPTGAIVFARVNGDVLAAASFPDRPRGPATGAAMRDRALERTLRRPGFQPPGSVFKPFVAAWALDHLEGYDPRELVDCTELPDGSGAGWKGLRCWRKYGHREVPLEQALAQSCNSYFAWLGEQFATDDFRGLAGEFGFGRPTGVRAFPERGGLREDHSGALLAHELRGREYLMAGNGLGVIEVTPMQIARAYAGLATGRLPQMRLVDRVGGEPLPYRDRPLGLSEAALERVRAALWEVTNGKNGSGRDALSTAALGFPMAAKTGSADVSPVAEMASDGVMRVPKHTWLAGWFPPEDPQLVIVVFVQRTLATSSHSSTWIARDFLRNEAVLAFIDEELGDR